MAAYRILSVFALSLSFLSSVESARPVCPYILDGTPILNDSHPDDTSIPTEEEYETALPTLDIESVFDDLYDLLRSNYSCFPPDTFPTENYDSYAGLMIRLAWHCAGTFRDGDNVGGCAGGRQRYEGEASMDDNVNLDKARALLAPIKQMYGDALSWGDLFVFAGTAAILQGGGPVTSVCAGRIDNVNGDLSNPLFNSSTCSAPDAGDCQLPLGSTKVGLIYVDAGGFLGQPDPNITAPHIREIFKRMGMNDSETVALIGGGHAFGKAHGACMAGAGDPPSVDPHNPWPGLCTEKFPAGVFTSGFEGQWTTYPFTWDNEYFTQLINDEYEPDTSPAGNNQFRNTGNGYFMLVTDIALLYDDDYLEIVTEFATNQDSLDMAFGAVWEKLMTSGGTFANNTFCVDGETLRPPADPTDTPMDMMTSTEEPDAANRMDIYVAFICVIGAVLSLLMA